MQIDRRVVALPAAWICALAGVFGLFHYPPLSHEAMCGGGVDVAYWLVSLVVVAACETPTILFFRRYCSTKTRAGILIALVQVPIAGMWIAAWTHHSFTICF